MRLCIKWLREIDGPWRLPDIYCTLPSACTNPHPAMVLAFFERCARAR